VDEEPPVESDATTADRADETSPAKEEGAERRASLTGGGAKSKARKTNTGATAKKKEGRFKTKQRLTDLDGTPQVASPAPSPEGA